MNKKHAKQGVHTPIKIKLHSKARRRHWNQYARVQSRNYTEYIQIRMRIGHMNGTNKCTRTHLGHVLVRIHALQQRRHGEFANVGKCEVAAGRFEVEERHGGLREGGSGESEGERK